MKISYLSCVAAIVLILGGCGSPDYIEAVKSGVMENHKTLTVGDAFDKWGECRKRAWDTFETDNGRRVVQFTCEVKNVKRFMSKVKSMLKNEGEYQHFDLQKVLSVFQWTINQDGTFQLHHTGVVWEWSDGKVKEVSGGNGLVEAVYSNDQTFDMSMLNKSDSLDAVRAARSYADSIYMLYDSAR